MSLPLLYSFRRCPYAMRARLALTYAGIELEHREILLKDKPQEMLDISPKGTVPVLVLPNGTVIEESLDIMHWALKQHDPDHWLIGYNQDLIIQNDTFFKRALDRYKYPNRYPDEDCSGALDICLRFIEKLESYISPDHTTLTDIAIFPFIRQFSKVDPERFISLPSPQIHKWLKHHVESSLCVDIMKKYPVWTPAQ